MLKPHLFDYSIFFKFVGKNTDEIKNDTCAPFTLFSINKWNIVWYNVNTKQNNTIKLLNPLKNISIII